VCVCDQLTTTNIFYRKVLSDLTFRGPCIMIYSYNKSRWVALFLKFIWSSTLHVSDRSTVHHQEYLNTAYTQ